MSTIRCRLLAIFAMGAFVFCSSLAVAQNNIFGIYTDQTGTPASSSYDATVNVPFNAYLVLTNPVNESYNGGTNTAHPVTLVDGFECKITKPSGTFFQLAETFPANAIDIGTKPDYIVGYATPVAVTNGAVVLCTWQFMALTEDPFEIYLNVTDIQAIPGAMSYQDNQDPHLPLQAAYPSSGDFSLPVFGVNTGALSSNSLRVDPTPDTINAPWTLEGPSGYFHAGSGDYTILNAEPGDYIITWGDVLGWATPEVNPATVTVLETGTFVLQGLYGEFGDIIINPLPSLVNAPWVLDGPNGIQRTGNRYQLFPGMEPGDYTLTWGSVAGWVAPAANPVTLALSLGSTITFQDTYVSSGSVSVDVDPDELDAPWLLQGPGGFQYPGTGDLVLPNMEPGPYSLTWGAIEGWTAPADTTQTLTLELSELITFVGVYDASPVIGSVVDVPNDQGRQVRLIWSRCGYDAPGYSVSVSEYGVYRRQPSASPDANDKLADWDFIGVVPARGDDIYQLVAPTLCDSTIAGGLCESTFMVSAMTASPYTYFDSPPACGYSVDNLRPLQPTGLSVAYGFSGNVLTWDGPVDTDVAKYLVYRSTNPEFPHGDPIAEVSGTTWKDNPGSRDAWDYYYWIAAEDLSGNQSTPTAWDGTQVSGVGELPLPQKLDLKAAVPNPFNPSTTIRYDLPTAQHVRLEIYGVDGRLVKTLVDEEREAGSHDVVWAGTDNAGRRVASGAYLYRVVVGGEQLQRMMTLIK